MGRPHRWLFLNSDVWVDEDMPKAYRQLRLNLPVGTSTPTRVELNKILGINGRAGLLQSKLEELAASGWIRWEKNVKDDLELVVILPPEEIPDYGERHTESVKRVTVEKELEQAWIRLQNAALGSATRYLLDKDRVNWRRALNRIDDAEMLYKTMERYWRKNSPFRRKATISEWYSQLAELVTYEKEMDALDPAKYVAWKPRTVSRVEALHKRLNNAERRGDEKEIETLRKELEAMENLDE